jgi:cell division septation protein DedD
MIAIVAVVLLIVAVAGYFLLISPQRSKAASLQKQIAQTQDKINAARALNVKVKSAPKVRVADLFRLTKAMPDQADEAGIILEINEIARETGISFESIEPQGAVVVAGYQAVPINLEFQGNFYDLSDFILRLRNLVDVRRGVLTANGRLFAIDVISFGESDRLFPQIKSTLTVDAFVYGTSSVATSPAEPAATSTASAGGGATTTPATGTTTTPTSSTTTTTTATTPASTSPSGSTNAAPPTR